MKNEYIKGWGIKLGTFSPAQYHSGEADKVRDEKIKEFNDEYRYTNMRRFRKGGKEFCEYYLCTADDVRI